jgi:hypothetical protein
VRQIRRQKFQCDETFEAGIFGLIDHTHAAATQPLHDAVVQYSFVNHEMQLW